MSNSNPVESWKKGVSGNPQGRPYTKGTSWKRIIADVGEEEPPADLREWGPSLKIAAVRRAFIEIIRGDIKYLPELMKYSEPNATEINIQLTDWHDYALHNIPKEILEERYKAMVELGKAVDAEFRLVEPVIIERPSDDSSSTESVDGAEGRTPPVASDSKAEDASSDSSIRDPIRGSEGRGEDIQSSGAGEELPPSLPDTP